MTRGELIRGTICHTPGDPRLDPSAFVTFDDGGLLVMDGRIAACGDFGPLQTANPDIPVTDWRGGLVLPGFVDTHVHFPQLRVIGHLGRTLLDWLEHAALPEERRMADVNVAERTAARFVHALAAHGTTTASVFGAHFAPAVAALFAAADRAGLRVASGLVVSDRRLHPDLHVTPTQAYNDSTQLIRRFHNHRRLQYSVTPRFALSASDELLEICGTLLREHPTVRCQTHINEQTVEMAEVANLFPWAADYLAVYERFGLNDRRTVFAHNVHPSSSELERLAASGATVAHCPASNAALGSGIFPLARHHAAGVRVALGTDVGGGTGFSVLREALQAHLVQRIALAPVTVPPGELLYLATRAGAEAVGLGDTVGDFSAGKAADLVHLRPPRGSVLADVLTAATSAADALAAYVTLSDASCVREVRVAGDIVHRQAES